MTLVEEKKWSTLELIHTGKDLNRTPVAQILRLTIICETLTNFLLYSKEHHHSSKGDAYRMRKKTLSNYTSDREFISEHTKNSKD